jgi:hypothetical protein
VRSKLPVSLNALFNFRMPEPIFMTLGILGVSKGALQLLKRI